jgi:hypothetical protein
MTAELLSEEQKMAELAKSFPCMAKPIGSRLWDANAIDRWAHNSPLSHGELVTVRFLLAVWDRDFDWECGRFDLMDALRVWDTRHYAAFLTWVRDPRWP